MTIDDMILAVRNGLEDGDAVEHITRALADEVERLHTWPGLMAVLDEHYPPDVVDGGSGAIAAWARIVALMREVERLRAARERALVVADDLDTSADHPVDPKVTDPKSQGWYAGLAAAEQEAARRLRLALAITDG